MHYDTWLEFLEGLSDDDVIPSEKVDYQQNKEVLRVSHCALVIGWRKQCKMCQVYLNARQNVFQVFLKGRLNMPVRRDLSMQQSYVLSLAWYEVRFYEVWSN